MKGSKFLSVSLVLLSLLLLSLGPTAAQEPDPQAIRGTPAQSEAQAPLGSVFTYQGHLLDDGAPVDNSCDFQFALYDDPISGTLVAGPLEQTGVSVTAGRFTVLLDFGDVFDGTALWLEIAVQCSGDADYATLSPRQPLTGAPYAAYSQVTPWEGITNLPKGFADNIDNDALATITATVGQVAKWDGSAWVATADDVEDDDADLTNELNDLLTLNGTLLLVGDAGGTLWTDLGSLIDDADADPTNELNLSLALSGTNLLVSDAGGTLETNLASLDTLQNLYCADGQIAKWNYPPGQWECAADEGSAYNAGFGLVLTDTTFSVVTSTIQQRVSGACAVGSTVRAINADGTVVCESHDTRPGFLRTTMDSVDIVGQYPSMIVGADGLGLISYYDDTNGDLKVAHCNDVACTNATIYTLDSTGNVGMYTSVTIGADGLGLISYYDESNGDLKVAHCNDSVCSSATLTALDNSVEMQPTSVTIGSDGLGLIAYYDGANTDLKVAHCNNVACTSATISTLDSDGNVGANPSIVIGADGLGLIGYRRSDTDELKVAHCNDVVCTSAIISTLDDAGNVGYYASITIGTDGLGLISYYDSTNGDLKVAHCDNVACSSATIYTLDAAGSVGMHTSVTIGADGRGLISYYYETDGDLRVAHCNDVACTSATIITLDSTGSVGMHTSVTIGTDGLGLISYYDESNGDLRVAHCSNPFCIPYYRQR